MGSGGFNACLSRNRYFHQIVDEEASSEDGLVFVQTLSGADDLDVEGTVPLSTASGTMIADSVDTSIEPVRHPEDTDLPQAVGWKGAKLYGLYADEDAANAYWVQLISSTAGTIKDPIIFRGEL